MAVPPDMTEKRNSAAATVFALWRSMLVRNTIDATLTAVGLGDYLPGSRSAQNAFSYHLLNYGTNGGTPSRRIGVGVGQRCIRAGGSGLPSGTGAGTLGRTTRRECVRGPQFVVSGVRGRKPAFAERWEIASLGGLA